MTIIRDILIPLGSGLLTAAGGWLIYLFLKTKERKKLFMAPGAKTFATETDMDNLIVDPEDAAAMLRQIQRDMAKAFGFILHTPISARLIGLGDLRRKCDYRGNPLGMFTFEDHRITIYILFGMPRARFYATLAHEYAHVWQAMEGFLTGTLEHNEGFAEWTALVLTQMAGFDTKEEFDRASWDPYGTGMRKFITLQKIFGVREAAQLGKRRRLNLNMLRGNYN
ncbi:MAG: hypothetical protein AB1656_18890 [Candidatus Omnitrophota bacterium]